MPAACCASARAASTKPWREFARAQRLERLLASEHVVRGRRARPDAPGPGADGRHGRRASVRSPVRARNSASAPGCASRSRRWSSTEDNPERAVEALAPVIDGSAPALYERWARVEALLLDATARDRLGDRRAAEESLEAALELAEPEGLILPFMLWPSRELLERHPGAPHRPR